MLSKCSFLLFKLTSCTLKTTLHLPSREATSAEPLALEIFRKEVYFPLRHMKPQCSGIWDGPWRWGRCRYLGMAEKEGESYPILRRELQEQKNRSQAYWKALMHWGRWFARRLNAWGQDQEIGVETLVDKLWRHMNIKVVGVRLYLTGKQGTIVDF